MANAAQILVSRTKEDSVVCLAWFQLQWNNALVALWLGLLGVVLARVVSCVFSTGARWEGKVIGCRLARVFSVD